MSAELKPCPFCGGDDLVPSFHDNGQCKLVCIACEQCEAEGPARAIGSDPVGAHQRASMAWNERASPSAQEVEGWVIIPEIPTTAMKAAGAKITGSWDIAHGCWETMLAAAPSPPSSPSLQEIAEAASAQCSQAQRDCAVLQERVKVLEEALKPFANAVFNDNGDVTITTSDIRHEHWLRAYKRYLAATLPQGETPDER